MNSKRRLFNVLSLAALTSLALVIAAQASPNKGTTIKVNARLSSKQETPMPKVDVRSAAGGFQATLLQTKKGCTMSWHIAFGKLSGKATSAYIHSGGRGKYGPALFRLCGPCTSGAHGSAYASPSEVQMMLAGKTYVNVRTSKNPTGEIRGQLAKSS